MATFETPYYDIQIKLRGIDAQTLNFMKVEYPRIVEGVFLFKGIGKDVMMPIDVVGFMQISPEGVNNPESKKD